MSTNDAINDVDAAQSSVQSILETVKTYGDSVHQSIKQGTAFNDVSEKTAQAAEYVAELSTRLKSAKTFGDLPVDTVGDLVAKALVALSAAADQAAVFDHKYALSQNLYTTIEGAVTQAKDSLSTARAKFDATTSRIVETAAQATHSAQDVAAKVTEGVTSAAGTLAAQEPVQRAHAALQDLATKLQSAGSSEPVTTARELLHNATERVGRSLQHFSEVPLTEKPVVVALEALELAKSAVSAVAGAVGSVVVSAAGSAVDNATTQLTSLKQRLSLLANAGVDYAVHKAVALDSSFSITDRVKSIDETYGVTAKVTALAADIDKSYNVTETALGAVERAKALDSSITGGRVTALTTTAVGIASAAVDYAKTIVQKFEDEKTQQQTSAQPQTTTQAQTSPVEASKVTQ